MSQLHTPEAKIKRFVKQYLKKIDEGKPFDITFNGDKVHISQKQIDSFKPYKEVHGGFLLPLLGSVIGFIKKKITGNGLNGERKEGGLLPLLTLLPLIFGGIGAAGATAGGIAGAVKAANDKAKNDLELAEQKRHNASIEKVVLGNGCDSTTANGCGIFLQPYKGKSLKDILTPIVDKIDGIETEGKKSIRKTVQALSPFFKIFESKDGNGIYLSPK